MKFLFITHQLSRTGAPIVFLDMLRIYLGMGHDITLISLLDGPLHDELNELGIEVSVKDDFFKDRERFKPYAESFDAVFCNTLITYQVIHVLNGADTPVFWWIHEGEQYFDYFKTVLPDMATLSKNVKVLSVGHYVQDVIRRRFGIDTDILHFGIEDMYAEPDVKRDNKKIRFVIAGTYSKVKGQDVLCDAIRKLKTEYSDKSEFIFCGNEESVDEYVFDRVETLCKDYPNVEKRASLPRNEMIEVMRDMDYLIVPSRVDPIPTVAAEAMMLKKPCIITEVCGIAYYLADGDNAFVCPTEDADALCDRIMRAVDIRTSDDESEYNDMCNSAREVYEDHFSKRVFEPAVRAIVDGLETKAGEKLIFAVGVYDILDIFTYAMLPEFERLGYETYLFDSSDMVKSLGGLYEFIKTPVKACITFNNLAFNTELVPGQNMWDALGIPIINILMDHPFCHKKALDNAPGNAIVLCPDMNHMRYLQRFYPQIPMVGFLPHGGKLLDRQLKPISKRSIDIIYAGGISRKFAYEMMPDFSRYAFDARDIADKAYEMMICDPSLTTEEAIEAQVKVHGVTLPDEELCALIEELHYIDLLIVSHYREKTIRTLAEAGLNIVLFGTGWEVCDWIRDCPTLDFRGRISANEIVETMHDAKIVLSTMTWFKDGTHDRVYNGMLAGAVAITDTSIYMKENYPYYPIKPASEAEFVMFELTELESLATMVKGLLSDNDTMQTIADNGRKRAVETDTWAKRADEIHTDLLSYM